MKRIAMIAAIVVHLLMVSACYAQWNWDPAYGTLVQTDILEFFPPTVYPSDSGHVFIIWGEMDSVIVFPFPIPQYVRGLRLQRLAPDGSKLFGEKGQDIVFYGHSLIGSGPFAMPWKDGGIIITWAEFSTHTILALDKYGHTVWRETTSFHPYEASGNPPFLVPDGRNGLFIVPLEHGSNWGAHQRTFVYRMDSTGTMMWPSGVIADKAAPLCAYGDGRGNVYVGNETEQRGVFLNKMDSTGKLCWGSPSWDNPNNLDTYIHNQTMQIVDDGYGGAFATWIRGDGHNIITHISSGGIWSTGPVGVSTGLAATGYTGNRTSMVKNGAGQVIVAWESYGDSVLVQCFDTTGASLWNNGTPTFLATESVIIAVVRNTPQTVIVFYSRSNGNDEDIFAKMLSNDGQILWNQNEKPISTAPGDQMAQTHDEIAIPHLNGGAFIAWKDYRSSTIDVYCTAIDSDGNSLPVELESFSVTLVESTVLLSWRTASETDNAGFRIQRSIDGNEWNEIGFVPGAGTAAIAHEYHYSDAIGNLLSNGGLYYRLKQVDFDGSYEYSPLQYVSFADLPLIQERISIHPNPVSTSQGVVQLSSNIPLHGPMQIIVYDALGRTVLEESVATSTSSALFQLPSGSITPGIYYLKITGKNINETTKLVVVR